MALYFQPFTDAAPVLLVIQVAGDGGVEDAFTITHGLHIKLGVAQGDQVGNFQGGEKLPQRVVHAGTGAGAVGDHRQPAGAMPVAGGQHDCLQETGSGTNIDGAG